MSTTVTYKGSTLTTATNQTRVLKTAGTVMEDDVTITDVSQITTYTITLSGSGGEYTCYVLYNNTKYYTSGSTITFSEGDTLYCYASGGATSEVLVNGDIVASNYNGGQVSYTYALPGRNVDIELYSSPSTGRVSISSPQPIVPSGTLNVTANDTYDCTTYAEVDVNVPSASLGTKTITSNNTYYASADNLDGYSSVTVNVPGGSSFTKLATQTYTVNTTNTTATNLSPTIDLGSAGYTSDKMLYVHVRGNSGKRNGYFYGTSSFLFNFYPKNGATSSSSAFRGSTFKVTSGGLYQETGTLYGVYPYQLTSDGVLTMRQRYNSTNTLTINDTFTVDVYLVTPPSTLFT